MNLKNNKYRILSIDGGGMKGVFTAFALWKLEEDYDIKIIEHFDMIIGTSTGAIIAAAILSGITGKDIYESYINENSPIFSVKNNMATRINKLFMAQYSSEGLNKYLNSYIDDISLDDLYIKSGKKDFAFFASNFTKANPVIYGSPSFGDSKIIKNEKSLINVLKKTTAAPFYFEPFKDENNELIIDGGFWANDPSLAGVNLAMGNLNIPKENIEVLSFGQTFTDNYEFKIYSKSEVIKNPIKQQFSQLLLSTLALNQNAQSTLVGNLIGNKLYKYKPEVFQENISIDKVSINFLNYAKIYWRENKKTLVDFIITGENNKKYN